jgi:hypothetical protein
MLSEYIYEVVEDGHPKILVVVAVSKENAEEKLKVVYPQKLKLLEIKHLNY